MALNSINTNVGAYYAQSNIGKASQSASLSIARLSSGQRIVRAADDVAAMSAGTSLKTNVTTLRMALVNTSQGSSLLQVADGALGQITDILQRQKSIAVQAGSGSLTSSERSFLNQEFQNLTSEIDRLVGQTNFNGVSLLDGSLSETVAVTDVDTAAVAGELRVSFVDTIAAAETIVINGVTMTAIAPGAPTAVQFEVGGTIQDTIDNLVTQLNASTSTSLSGATYSREGNSLVIKADVGGVQGQTFYVDSDSSTALDTAGEAVVSGKGASSVHAMLSSNALALNNITDDATAVAAATATPFQIAQTIAIDLGAGAVTVHTFAANESLEDIVNSINSNTNVHGFTARIIGSAGAYNLEFETSALTTDNSYTTANAVDLDFTGSAAATVALGAGYALDAAANTTNNFNFYLDAADDLGIGRGDVTGYGVIGNDIITDQNQQVSELSIIFPEIADADLTSTTNFGNATISDVTLAGVTFAWAVAATGPTEAAIGATLEETLDNMVSAINSYSGTESQNYVLDQIEALRDGNSIVIRSLVPGAPLTIAGAAVTVTSTNLPTGASVTNAGNLNSGQTGGVNASGINNADFIGTISNFNATYNGTSDQLTLSVTVGEFTYTGELTNTAPAANATLRLSAEGGGYLDIQLAANKGMSVSSQVDADAFAQRVNAAFSSLTFYQNREISSFVGDAPILTDGVVTGTLIGTSFELESDSFESVKIDSIRVAAPQGSSENGSIVITINGEEYSTAANIGSTLGASSVIEFVNELDASKVLTFRTGDTAIDFSSDETAAAFEDALREAFGVGDGSAELKFQVGTTVSDTLSVGLESVTTRTIYGGLTLDVLTAESAATASDVLDDAINIVTSVRAEVGALQSRFDFAAANVESSIQNQDAARGILLDTDIAAESTSFATSQVKLQAGIAVLAQANLLPQNLLKLIG